MELLRQRTEEASGVVAAVVVVVEEATEGNSILMAFSIKHSVN